MTNRETRIMDLIKTVNNHRRVGNVFMAEKMEKRIDLYVAMTDAEYEAQPVNPAAQIAAKQLADEVVRGGARFVGKNSTILMEDN